MKKISFVLTLIIIQSVLLPAFNNADSKKSKTVSKWMFNKSHLVNGNAIKDLAGNNNAKLSKQPQFATYLDKYEALKIGKKSNAVTLSSEKNVANFPVREMTVEAVVKYSNPISECGIIGYMQDNGSYEKGWILGYSGEAFGFILSSVDASDGDGDLTKVVSTNMFEIEKWYHLAATYDGKEIKLFVNGNLEGSSKEQSGDILYPDSGYFDIGAYHDLNEYNVMEGEILMASLYEKALSEKEIVEKSEKYKDLLSIKSDKKTGTPQITVKPYLQLATKTEITILWETNRKTTTVVKYGEKIPLDKSISIKNKSNLHEVRIKNLKPQTSYFYKVESVAEDGTLLESDVYTFQTAVEDDSPYAFTVFGDTQNNPEIWNKIADYAWNERPNFALHCGDIVGTGHNKWEWVNEFLGPGHIFMSRYPVYTVLGNHDEDAKYYYNYTANPDKDYCYTFTYGNAQFFMIDSNRDLKEGSEQYQWLEKELASSTATWKFAAHHHPPYSSDENDYGDTYKGKSKQGDAKVTPLIKLYEKYNVDMVFFGHIHDYERTWPIRDNKVVEKNGVIYIQTGGAGGGLENYAPTRSWFTAKVRRDHHFCYLTINGKNLVLTAIDQNRVTFDRLELKK